MTEVNYVKMGQVGSPIVMLHGWGQSLESMRILGDLLSRYHQVYLIDFPGFGKTEKPKEDWDTVDYARCIDELFEKLHLESAIVIGHSFGGRVGMRMAVRHKKRVSALILINTGGLKSQLKGKRLYRAKALKVLSNSLKWCDSTFATKYFEEWFVPKYASRDYRNAGALKNILVKTVNEDQSADAGQISCPTFLLWGEKDQETPVEMGYRLKSIIPNAQLLVLPEKDHFPFIDEGAHLCAHYILEFLNQKQLESPAVRQGDLANV
ncbi:MAG: alpha/beta hydrolase [Candidatus Melainabacteria bacterium]|nr:alpha/beta hydrolase [Candidatus Melainabacteria bacterium]